MASKRLSDVETVEELDYIIGTKDGRVRKSADMYGKAIGDLNDSVTDIENDVTELTNSVSDIENDVTELTNSVSDIGDSLNGFKFGIDANGNYGYYKDGADTVTPFKTGGKLTDCIVTAYGGVIFTSNTAYSAAYVFSQSGSICRLNVSDFKKLKVKQLYSVYYAGATTASSSARLIYVPAIDIRGAKTKGATALTLLKNLSHSSTAISAKLDATNNTDTLISKYTGSEFDIAQYEEIVFENKFAQTSYSVATKATRNAPSASSTPYRPYSYVTFDLE